MLYEDVNGNEKDRDFKGVFVWVEGEVEGWRG